jgi:hypothetical protein
MRGLRLLVVLLFASFAGIATATAQGSIINQIITLPLTIKVDCDAGQSVADALISPGGPRCCGPLTVEFKGTCVEDLTIARDDVTVEGVDEDAAIVGTVYIEGASRVTLVGFTIRDSDGNGLHVRGAAAVTLDKMVVRDNFANGLFLWHGSSARIIDSSFLRNGFDGISVWGNSSVTPSGTIEANENGRVGVLVSTGSGMQGSGSVVVANDNVYGLVAQVAASVQGGSLTTNGNLVGIYLTHGTMDSALEASGNSYGAVVQRESDFFMWGGWITDSGAIAAYVDGSSIGLWHTNVDEILLIFGSKASFDGGNTIGYVACDGTVLTRGDASCSKAVDASQSVPFDGLFSMEPGSRTGP